jgi:hypothetical protein
VLRHEAAHLRRRDAWLLVGMQVLLVAAWPVAPLWIAVGRVRRLIELACDEAALAGADASERRRYGHVLLDMAERFSVSPLGAGELGFGSTLRARIAALAPRRRWPLAAQALALSIAPAALLAACSGPAVPPAASPDAEGYGYAFETDSPRAAAQATASPPPPPGPDGRLPPEAVQATVRARFTAFRACYEAGLARDPELTGTVTVMTVFGEDGVTKEASDKESTLPDKGVVDCIVGEFRKLAYPRARGGDVTVLYPIELAPR